MIIHTFRWPLHKWCFFFFTLVAFTSCVETKRATYFSNIQDAEFPEVDVEPVIQKNDVLSINVSSLNPAATAIFNPPTQAAGTATPELAGYLVNRQGEIQFPILGNIKAAGLTVRQFSDNLTNFLVQKKLLVDPIVTARVLNFKVTVLGEVAKPSVIPVANEKISILEALGMAGDLTVFAKRDNVLLIRVEEGKRITRRINLNNNDIFTSPFFYLKNNDVLYVEPNEAKVATSSRTQQLAPIVLSSLSLVAVIITAIIR